jgi:hypothetical protein
MIDADIRKEVNMSLKDLGKPELVTIANEFGVESTGTKAKIIEALAAEGIDDDYLAALTPAAPVEATAITEVVEQKSGEEVVVALVGLGSYGMDKYRWTVSNPFQVVPKELADKLISESPEGFRIATETEIEDFYS